MLPLNELCDRLAKSQADSIPLVVRLKWCVEAGVFRWFIPQEYGGWGWMTQRSWTATCRSARRT